MTDETKTEEKHYCRGCNASTLKAVTNPSLLDPLFFWALMYCDNLRCERYGLVTVADTKGVIKAL